VPSPSLGPAPLVVATPSPTGTTSPTIAGSPGSTPDGSSGWLNLRKNWWKYLLAILVLLPAAFAGYRALRRASYPRPTIHSHLDPGAPGLKGSMDGMKNFAINFELLLNPQMTEGQSRISASEANLVRSERRDDG
jgi:hypothetical protein